MCLEFVQDGAVEGSAKDGHLQLLYLAFAARRTLLSFSWHLLPRSSMVKMVRFADMVLREEVS